MGFTPPCLEVLRVDGYNPKLHALTGEAHGMAAALNVPSGFMLRVGFLLVGWLQGTAHQNQQLYINGVKWETLSMVENKGGFHCFFFTPNEISVASRLS